MIHRRPKILHVITSLDRGGAESVLKELISSTPSFSHRVICLKSRGHYSEFLEDLSIPIFYLNLSKANPFPLLRIITSLFFFYQSHLVSSYLYHADLFSSLVCLLPCTPPILWNIHNAYGETDVLSKKTRFIVRLLSSLSYVVPKAILYVSQYAKSSHRSHGFNQAISFVIPNPVRTDLFVPIPRETSISLSFPNNQHDRIKQSFVFGVVARFHPVKRHESILRAFSSFLVQRPGSLLVLVGDGCVSANTQLSSCINHFGLADNVILLGPCDQPSLIYSSFDCTILYSSSESFGNVVAESLSCGVPVIATSLPSLIEVCSKYASYVSTDSQLVQALLNAYDFRVNTPGEYQENSLDARRHIISRFSTLSVVSAYVSLWKYLVGSPSDP